MQEKIPEKMQEQRRDFKNYYQLLEITPNATLKDIERSYQRLALKWHPDKHTVDRKLAQRKFHQISEAFDVLSDPNKRSTYDQMFHKQESLENAYKTFDRFYGQKQMMDEEEQKFFQKNFPDKRKNYYKILGINKEATQEQIERAYRKLALKYHPKNNQDNEQAHRKFIEVNQAYQTLCSQLKRNTYDDLIGSQIVPGRAHNIFEDFFKTKWMDLPEEEDFFKPIFDRRNRLFTGFDTLMPFNKPYNMITSSILSSPLSTDLRNVKEGQSFQRQERVELKDGRENRTSEITKRKIHNGVVQQETVKENVLPNGERDVIKTIKKGDKIDTKTYHLKRNEELPRQLRQLNY